MSDVKAPERIWADVIVWGDMEPLAGEWNCRDVGRPEDTEYVRADLHDALAKERDELAARVKYLEGVGDVDGKLIQKTAGDAVRYKAIAEKAESEVERLRGLSQMAGRALETVLAGKPVRNADEVIASCNALHRKEGDE